jgi:hypothetical protein
VKVIVPTAVVSGTGWPPEEAVLTVAVTVTVPSNATCDMGGVTTTVGVDAVPLTVCVTLTVAELKLLSPE